MTEDLIKCVFTSIIVISSVIVLLSIANRSRSILDTIWAVCVLMASMGAFGYGTVELVTGQYVGAGVFYVLSIANIWLVVSAYRRLWSYYYELKDGIDQLSSKIKMAKQFYHGEDLDFIEILVEDALEK